MSLIKRFYEDISEMVVKKGFNATVKHITGKYGMTIDDAMKEIDNAMVCCDCGCDGDGDSNGYESEFEQIEA